MKVKSTITAVALALSLVAGTSLAATTDTDTTTMPGNGPGYGMMNGQGPCHGMGGTGWYGGGMRRGVMMNPEMKEKRNAFLNSTRDLRKSIYEKRFIYMEAQRNPDITVGELQKQEKELFVLRQQLMKKRQAFF